METSKRSHVTARCRRGIFLQHTVGITDVWRSIGHALSPLTPGRRRGYMARIPRLDPGDAPVHISLQGSSGRRCFLSSDDYLRYLYELRLLACTLRCQIHAYALTLNDVQILASPGGVGIIPKLMHALGCRYARYIKDRYGHGGRLWEGRYRAYPVDANRFLLKCIRYIEHLPVDQKIAKDPAMHPWSSHRANALGHNDPLITPHPLYLALGKGKIRAINYRCFSMSPVTAGENETIRDHLRSQRPLGALGFKHAIMAAAGCSIHHGRIGRPPNTARKNGEPGPNSSSCMVGLEHD